MVTSYHNHSIMPPASNKHPIESHKVPHTHTHTRAHTHTHTHTHTEHLKNAILNLLIPCAIHNVQVSRLIYTNFKFFASIFEDHRLERADFIVGPSIGARPGTCT